MRTLVIPDIHNHIDSAEAWVQDYPADQVVFLGDYFDSVGDTPATAAKTARWLRDSLQDPKRIHLWGNHDLPYLFPDDTDFTWCPGFTREKWESVYPVLNWKEHWSRLRFVEFVGDFALSHAGISWSIFKDLSQGAILETCGQGMAHARQGKKPLHPVFTNLGIVWQRWWTMDFLPEYHQIVGHTSMPEAAIEWEHGRLNVCIDTYGKYLGWIEDQKFSLIETATREMRVINPNKGL